MNKSISKIDHSLNRILKINMNQNLMKNIKDIYKTKKNNQIIQIYHNKWLLIQIKMIHFHNMI